MVEKRNCRNAKTSIFAFLMLFGGTFFTGCTYDSVQPDFCFETEVLPIFRTYCSTSGCHNPIDREEGYDLTTYEGIMRGIKPKSIAGSKLLEAMEDSGDDAMPPKGSPQPSQEQISTIKAWVKSGAENTTGCGGVTCDSAAAVTYSLNIKPLLTTYCIGCHSGGGASGGLDFSQFSVVAQAGLNGRLAGSIKGDPSYVSMPPNSPLLPACYALQIEKWVADGAKEN